MKFVDRLAYVHTALFGYSFTKGCQENYFLVVRNTPRMSDGLNAGWLRSAFVKVLIAAALFLLMGLCIVRSFIRWFQLRLWWEFFRGLWGRFLLSEYIISIFLCSIFSFLDG